MPSIPSIIVNQLRDFQIHQERLQTVDDTEQVILSVPTKLNSCILVKLDLEAFRSGGTLGMVGDNGVWERTFRIKNIGNVVGVVDVQSDFTSKDQEEWSIIPDVSGTNFIIKIKGSVGNNINWNCMVMVREIKSSF